MPQLTDQEVSASYILLIENNLIFRVKVVLAANNQHLVAYNKNQRQLLRQLAWLIPSIHRTICSRFDINIRPNFGCKLESYNERQIYVIADK